MGKSARVTVFEAINRSRREIFIGATAQPMHVMISAFRAAPPAGTESWLPDEVEYRSLAFDVELEQAEGIVRRYAAAQEGWKVRTSREIIAP